MGKIDCSITANYLKEKGRMTDNCFTSCNKCPLAWSNNGSNCSCNRFEVTHPEKAINIVQKWSDEHPQKTILEDFMEKHPNAPLFSDKTPQICPITLGYWSKEEITGCLYKSCLDCWNQPLPKND